MIKLNEINYVRGVDLMEYIVESFQAYLILLPCLVIFEILLCIYYTKDKQSKKHIHVPISFIIGWQFFACFMIMILYITSPANIKDFMDFGAMKVGNFNLTIYDFLGSSDQRLNVLLFIPLGFLLPSLWKQKYSLIQTLCTGFLLSLTIELLQMFNFRASDINDLFANTVGTLCGYIIYWIIMRRCEMFKIKTNKMKGIYHLQPFLNVFGIVTFYFFLGVPILDFVFHILNP